MKLPSFSLRMAALPWLAFQATLPAASLSWDPLISGGTTLGGSGNFTNNAADLFWWNGTSNVPWTDLTGVDTAVLNVTPDPGLPAPANTVSIASGTTITANGLTFAIDGYTLAGPGSFNFRNNTATATAPATLTVPTGITGRFTAANNQNNGNFPPITITGGGTLDWGTPGTGTKITLEGGTLVRVLPGGQRLGGGTNNINNGIYRFPADAGNVDTVYDSATFTSTQTAGILDLNGSSEVIGNLSGSLNVTNTGALPAALLLSGTGTQTYTGVMSDGPNASSGLTLTGSVNAAGTGFTSVNNVLVQVIGKAQTYTGDTTIRRGTLRLAYNNAAASSTAADLLYNNAPAFDPASGTSRLIFGSAAPSATNPGLGGRSVMDIVGSSGGTNSQRFNGTVLEPYAAAGISFTSTASSTFTLDLGPLTRGAGSTLNLGTLTRIDMLTPTGTAGQPLTDNGIPWITIATTDWAFKDSTNTKLEVPPISSYDAASATTLPTDGNVNLPGGVNTRLLADTTIRSLRLNANERRSIAFGGHTLTVPAILFGSNIASAGNSLGGGTLTSPVSDLLFIHQAGSAYRYSGIGATISNGTNPAMDFTRSGTCGTYLTADNTFTGVLTVAQGTLILTGSNTPSGVLIQGNTTNSSGGSLPAQSNTITMLQLGNEGAAGTLGAAPVTIGSLATFAVKRSDAFVLPNAIGGSGNFHQAGTGTTTLAGPATDYSWRGDTIVSGGVLELDNTTNDGSKIPNLAALRLGGGTVRLLGGGHIENVSRLDLNSGASTLETAGGSSGVFRLNGLNGLGTTTAAGTAGGTLNVAASGIADTDTANTNGIIGATARITVAGQDWATSGTTAADTPITAYSSYQPLALTAGTDTAHSVLSAAAVLTGNRTTASLKIDASSAPAGLDLGAANTLSLTSGGLLLTGSQPVTLTNGNLRSTAAVSPDLLIHNFATQPVMIQSAIIFGNQTTGQSHVTLSGPGTTILSGAGRYGGNTYINGGTVSISSGANIGGGNGTIDIASSATNSATVTLTSSTLPAGFGPGSRMLGQTVNTISGTTVTLAGNAAVALTNSTASWATGNLIALNRGTLRVTGTVSLQESNADGSGGTSTLTRPFVLNGTGGAVDITAGSELTLTGNITGPGGFEKLGEGTLVLANPNGGNNTANGPTRITAGTVRMGGAANGLSFNSDITIAPAGTLDLNGVSQTLGSLGGGGLLTNGGFAGATITVGTTFADSVYSGVIQDGNSVVSLTKTGSGQLTLSGANTHSGTTSVEAGILVAANTSGSATGTGTINLGVAGTLAGTGTINGVVNLSGALAPGLPDGPDTTGTLGFDSDLNFNSTSVMHLEIGGTTAGSYDKIQTTGSLNLAFGQDIRISLKGYTPAAGDVFPLVSAGFLNAAEVNFSLPALSPGLQWDLSQFAVDGTISVKAGASAYNTWLAGFFSPAELADPLLSGPAADADNDGLANAIEFAAGTSPRNAASGTAAALPTLGTSSVSGLDYATLTFTANTANLPGITIAGQSGLDLTAWPDTLPLLSSTPNGDGTTTLIFRSQTATSIPVRRFYRLIFTPVP